MVEQLIQYITMKNLRIIYLFSVLLAFTFSGCDKKYEELYRVTYYPVMTVKGDLFISLPKGSTFTDPGATAIAGNDVTPVTVSGSVDPNTIGTYSLTYTAVNKDSFEVTSSRVVGIYDPSVVANDFSGNYARSTNQSLAVWTKIAPGMYEVFNPGGAPGTVLTIHVFNTNGSIITVPSQVSSDGSITSCNNKDGGSDIIMDTATNTYVWQVVNPGYGPSLRTFTKK